MALRSWLPVVWLVGCAPPAAPLAPPLHRPRPRCELRSEALQCGGRRVPLSDLGVQLPLRAVAARAGGGLWLLDEARQLLRVDAHGEPTALASTDFAALAPVGGLLCVLHATGAVSCLPDHAGDARCGELAKVADPIRLPLSFRQFVPGAPGLLCGLDAAGRSRCATLVRPCDRACLQYPDCGAPLRCADACAPGEAPLQLFQHDGPLG